jgi:hypothetical protein
MKVGIVLLGVLFCMAANIAGQPSRSVSTSKFVPVAQQSLTGCIDEQFGQYILLDGEMQKIVNLQSAGPEKEIFAKYLGHKVEVRGTRSSGLKPATFMVTGIAQIAGMCGQAK